MIICVCNYITEKDIATASLTNSTFDEFSAKSGCSMCCGCCEKQAKDAFGILPEVTEHGDASG